MIVMMMTDVWWSGESAGMIGGIVGSGLGILGGLIGSLVGVLAPRGVGRQYLLGGIFMVLVLCALSLLVGLFALLLAGQPWQVWYPLVLLDDGVSLAVPGCLPWGSPGWSWGDPPKSNSLRLSQTIGVIETLV